MKEAKESDKKLKEEDKWQSEVPYDTRELAIRRLRKSYVTAFSLLRNKKIENLCFFNSLICVIKLWKKISLQL